MMLAQLMDIKIILGKIERGKGEKGKGERGALYICAIFSDVSRQRPDKVDLVHAEHGADPADAEGGQRGQADGQLALRVPVLPVEVGPASPEEERVLERDGDPDGDPVAHERQEVLKDVVQVVTAHSRTDGVGDDAKRVPHKARHARRPAAQALEPQRGRVGPGNVVRDHAEREEDAAELAKPPPQRLERAHEQRARRDVVVGRPGRVRVRAGAQATAHEVGEARRQALAHPRQQEGQRLGRAGWIVHVVVTADRRPSHRGRHAQRQEREPVGVDRLAVARRAVGRVEIGAGHTDQDENDSELGGPGISGKIEIKIERKKKNALVQKARRL